MFCVFDHGAIYLLIAGTYTPFMLGALRGPWGWTLLALIWTMALAGVILKGLGPAAAHGALDEPVRRDGLAGDRGGAPALAAGAGGRA